MAGCQAPVHVQQHGSMSHRLLAPVFCPCFWPLQRRLTLHLLCRLCCKGRGQDELWQAKNEQGRADSTSAGSNT